MVPRWQFLATILHPVFSSSRMQQVSDLHVKFALATPCVEVWHTSNLRRLRLGEERKKEEEEQTENIMVCPIPQGNHKKDA